MQDFNTFYIMFYYMISRAAVGGKCVYSDVCLLFCSFIFFYLFVWSFIGLFILLFIGCFICLFVCQRKTKSVFSKIGNHFQIKSGNRKLLKSANVFLKKLYEVLLSSIEKKLDEEAYTFFLNNMGSKNWNQSFY